MNEASGSTYLQDSMPPKSGRLWWFHLGFTSTGCFKRSMHIEHTGVKSIRPRHPEGNAAQNTLSVECWLYACPPLTLTSAFHIVVIIEFLFLSLGRQRAKGISSNSELTETGQKAVFCLCPNEARENALIFLSYS